MAGKLEAESTENPHLLRIGDTLKVIKSRTIEAQRAKVTRIVQDVDRSAPVEGWVDATDGEEIGADEGVRTLAKSSANLEFNAESTLSLDEYSQVFLRDRETTLRGVDRGTIEVVSGGADLKWAPLSTNRPQTELTLVTGSATTVPKASVAGVELYAATDEDRRARLSMFEGSGEVAAAGASVNLSKGLGVAVVEGEPPGKPERLLPAPQPQSPGVGATFEYNNPIFTWAALDDASAYSIEICADPDCSERLLQATATAGSRWKAPALPVGDLYWRVAGNSASGLLGYASKPRPFTVARDWYDDVAPGVVAEVVGGSVTTANGEQRIGRNSRIVFHVTDDAAGGVVLQVRQGSDDWAPWDGVPLESDRRRYRVLRHRCVG